MGDPDRTCRRCTSVLVEDARFCHRCGAEATTEAPAGPHAGTPPTDPPPAGPGDGRRLAVGLAVAAAAAIKVPSLFGADIDDDPADAPFVIRNLGLFSLPMVAWLLARTRHPDARTTRLLPLWFAIGAVAANAWAFFDTLPAGALLVIHLPVALWFVVGLAHAGDGWRTDGARRAFIRFTGEWVVHFVLLGIGGLLLTGLTVGGLSVLGIDGLDEDVLFGEWVVPCGAMGAVVVAAWMAERRLADTEGVAPMLARAFTPLLLVVLLVLLVGTAVDGDGVDVGRDGLVLFDVLLLAVLGLLLSVVTSRDPATPVGLLDRIQFALLLAAVALDGVALAGVAVRIGDHGFTANRTATLGLNLLLLVHLTVSAWIASGVLRGRRPLHDLLTRQTRFLPWAGAWVVLVTVAFPPVVALT